LQEKSVVQSCSIILKKKKVVPKVKQHMIFLTHVRVEVVVSFSFVQAMPFICACVYIYMLVLVSNTHNHFIILHSHSEPYTQREKKKNERKQSLFGGDCHTSHICCYVSSLKSCIRSWHEQFHLRLL